jgi:hypothetical protein
MTLGNMRANGVRWLDVSCQCHHRAILSADRGPITCRSRKRSLPPFQTLSQIGNMIAELSAGPAVVPPINGSVSAHGGRSFTIEIFERGSGRVIGQSAFASPRAGRKSGGLT